MKAYHAIRSVATRCQFLAVLVTAAISISCVDTKDIALSQADRSAMKGRTVMVTKREKPHHFVMKQSAMAAASLGGAIGGAIAGGMADKEGQEQIAKHRIEDPNLMMSAAVSNALVAKTGARLVPSKTITSSLAPGKVAEQNPGAEYVLDCFTTSWMGTYYPMSIGKYFMTFGAKMQLIETSTGRVVAQGFSHVKDEDRENAPDYDGIYANDAAYLKAQTKRGTDAAVGKFNSLF